MSRAQQDSNPPSGSSPGRPVWSRASSALFGLMAVLIMAYGLLFMVSAGRSDQTAGPERGDVELISMQGEPVDLEKHLVPGKYTIVDFYADWCPPCQELTPVLEELARVRSTDVALRKVNIVHWGTPVVAQYGVADFGLPYLRMYGPDGTMVAEGVDPVMEEIRRRF